MKADRRFLDGLLCFEEALRQPLHAECFRCLPHNYLVSLLTAVFRQYQQIDALREVFNR